MIIKQGSNDKNIIAWALTSTIRVVASSITMIGARTVDIWALVTLILVPLIGVVIVITLILVIIIIIWVIWGSVTI